MRRRSSASTSTTPTPSPTSSAASSSSSSSSSSSLSARMDTLSLWIRRRLRGAAAPLEQPLLQRERSGEQPLLQRERSGEQPLLRRERSGEQPLLQRDERRRDKAILKSIRQRHPVVDVDLCRRQSDSVFGQPIVPYRTIAFAQDQDEPVAVVDLCQASEFPAEPHALFVRELYAEGFTLTDFHKIWDTARAYLNGTRKAPAGDEPLFLQIRATVPARATLGTPPPAMQDDDHDDGGSGFSKVLGIFLLPGPTPGSGVLMLHLAHASRPWRNPNNMAILFVVDTAHRTAAELAIATIERFNMQAFLGAAAQEQRRIQSVRFSLTHTVPSHHQPVVAFAREAHALPIARLFSDAWLPNVQIHH